MGTGTAVGIGPVNPAQVSGNADSAVPGSTPNDGSTPAPPQATPEVPTEQPNAASNNKPKEFKKDKEREAESEEDEVAGEDCEGPVCLID